MTAGAAGSAEVPGAEAGDRPAARTWAAAAGAPYRWRWAAFAVVLIASVMDLLDSLVTNVAGPAIRADLGGGSTLIQWLGAGYTLAMAVGLITGGRLGDIYGRRRMFLVGATGFTAASLLCSIATAPGELIAFRVAQGAFGALMLPQGLGVITEIFPPEERAVAFGAFGPFMGISSVAGPVLAGWLIDANYFGTGWRMIFLINLPLGLIAIAGGAAFLPRAHAATASRLDITGAALAAAASALLVYPVVEGRTLGWPPWAFALMAASVAVFAAFGWLETRKERAGGQPLIIPALFRKPAFTGGLVSGLAFFTAITGFSLVLTVYLQIGLGYSPLKAGLTALPQAAGSVAGFIAAGAGLATRLGRTCIHIGTATMAAGILAVILTLNIAAIPVTPWELASALAVMGAGMGLVLAPFFDIVLAGVEPHETGSASGTLTAVQQFGSALGVAVMGSIFFGLLTGPTRAAFTAALRHTLWAVAGLQLLTFALAFLLPRRAAPAVQGHPASSHDGKAGT
jgi:EmrB/QacA subfamily drug resistance transporter